MTTDLISEVEDLLTTKEIRDWANSPSMHESAEIRVIEMLDKKIVNLQLNGIDMNKRIFELERKLDSNKD